MSDPVLYGIGPGGSTAARGAAPRSADIIDTVARTWHDYRYSDNVERHIGRLMRDVRFRQELRYCYDQGIPHSWFLGGDERPRYADSGRRRPTEVPRWSADDRDKAVAYQVWADGVCPSCGVHVAEFDSDWRADPPYVAVPQVRPCCAIRERGHERMRERLDTNSSGHKGYGMSVVLRRRTRADDMREAQEDEARQRQLAENAQEGMTPGLR